MVYKSVNGDRLKGVAFASNKFPSLPNQNQLNQAPHPTTIKRLTVLMTINPLNLTRRSTHPSNDAPKIASMSELVPKLCIQREKAPKFCKHGKAT